MDKIDNDRKSLALVLAIFRLLYWLSLILGIAGGVIFTPGDYAPVVPSWMGIVFLATGIFYFFIFLGLSLAIKVLLDIYDRIIK